MRSPIDALRRPPHNGNIVVLFYADGREPVYAQIVFAGELISGSPPASHYPHTAHTAPYAMR